MKALPKMAKAASSPDLTHAFEQHLDQTRNHLSRLEEIFNDREGNPRGKKCKGKEGLIEESQEVIDSEMEGAVQGAALIAAAQRVEHYEIVSYGTTRIHADRAGDKKAASILDKTLEEESHANEKLTFLAEKRVTLKQCTSWMLERIAPLLKQARVSQSSHETRQKLLLL